MKRITTTKLSRFQDALTLLCGERPPASMCQVDILGLDDELLGWVTAHMSPVTPWATGSGTIAAAYVLAEEPEEGGDYDNRN